MYESEESKACKSKIGERPWTNQSDNKKLGSVKKKCEGEWLEMLQTMVESSNFEEQCWSSSCACAINRTARESRVEGKSAFLAQAIVCPIDPRSGKVVSKSRSGCRSRSWPKQINTKKKSSVIYPLFVRLFLDVVPRNAWCGSCPRSVLRTRGFTLKIGQGNKWRWWWNL